MGKSTATPEGFLITVEGQYYSVYMDGDGHQQKKIRNYKIQVKLPSMDAALSVIRNHLLDPALKKKYPDYTRYRTHIVKRVASLDGGHVSNIRYMGAKQLIQYIQANGLPIDTEIITDTQELREAISRYEDNPDQYEKWFAKISDERKTKQMLSALNPELFDEEEGFGDSESGSGVEGSDPTLDIG